MRKHCILVSSCYFCYLYIRSFEFISQVHSEFIYIYIYKTSLKNLEKTQHCHILNSCISCYSALPFIVLHISLCFLKLQGLWQPCIQHIHWYNYSNIVCSPRVSVSHFIILAIFQIFCLLYLLSWSVISDFWHDYCNCFGGPWVMLYKMVNLARHGSSWM